MRERVKGVIAKRDPADRRYWLFKANTQMEKTEVARQKMSGATYKAKADKQSVMDMMSAEKLELLALGMGMETCQQTWLRPSVRRFQRTSPETRGQKKTNGSA